MTRLIVSRHPAAVEFLRAECPEFADVPVLASATPDDVRGKIVGGNLPLALAASAAEVVAIEFGGAPPRGTEYGLVEMRAAGARLARYSVTALAPVVRPYDGDPGRAVSCDDMAQGTGPLEPIPAVSPRQALLATAEQDREAVMRTASLIGHARLIEAERLRHDPVKLARFERAEVASHAAYAAWEAGGPPVPADIAAEFTAAQAALVAALA